LKPHLKETWCIGSVNAAFLAQMERLLWLYALPLDSRFPVVCFDERPCFLIGDTVSALAMKAGSVRREHYEYEKHGSCALLAAIEPKTGKRITSVRPTTKTRVCLVPQRVGCSVSEGRENPFSARLSCSRTT
jgi:hypothetical protein